jgi:hypothetical protein
MGCTHPKGCDLLLQIKDGCLVFEEAKKDPLSLGLYVVLPGNMVLGKNA